MADYERERLAERVTKIGQDTEILRQELAATGKPFIAGMLAATEESLRRVVDLLDDPNVQSTEL